VSPAVVEDLIGRQHERARLRDALAAIQAGTGRITEIVGDPGIGKTRLLSDLAARAVRSGHRVAWGRAAEYERQVPLGIVTDALEDALAGLDADMLAPADLALLRTLFPALGGAVPADGGTAAGVLEAERHQLYRAIRAALSAIAGPAGLVVILDDLHWADEGSAELIDYLLRHPPHGPALLVLAHRPRQTPGRLRHALARAHQAGRTEVIAVEPLTLDDAAALLPTGLIAARRAELYAASGGNPLYLQALARETRPDAADADSAEDGVPDGVWAGLSAEFATLPPAALTVAHAAAVAGECAEPELIARTAGLDVPAVLAALDDLTGRDLLRPAPPGARFRFRHPLVRRVAYETAGAGWRIAAHARAAEALRASGAPATSLAHHVERCAQPGDLAAVDVLASAAQATLHTAPATAAHWLGAALRVLPHDPGSMPQRLELLVQHARAVGVTGRLAESRDDLHQLLQLIPPVMVDARAQLIVFAATIEGLLGRRAEAEALLLAELARLPSEHGPAALSLLLTLSSGSVLRSAAPGGRNWPAEALRAARASGEPAPLAAALALAVLAEHAADSREGDAAATTVQDLESWLDEAAAIVDALPDGALAQGIELVGWVAAAEVCRERLQDAIRHLDRLLAAARVAGRAHVISHLYGLLGSAHAMCGDFASTTECFDNEFETAQLTGSPAQRGTALEHQVWLAMWRGELSEAQRLGRQAIADATAGHYQISWSSMALFAQTELLVGDPDTAVSMLLLAGERPMMPTTDPVARIRWYESLAEARSAQGRADEAAACADDAEKFAARQGLPRGTGFAMLARVHALLAADEPSAAVQVACTATDVLAAAGDRIAAGRAHHHAGIGLAVTGDVDAARTAFARARELFDACAVVPLADRTVREERRMNARRPRQGDGSLLTPREMQVAQLVTEGLTNKEIAERLHLSAGTVGVHLAHVYTKLGVTRRAAVSGRLAELPQ